MCRGGLFVCMYIYIYVEEDIYMRICVRRLIYMHAYICLEEGYLCVWVDICAL